MADELTPDNIAAAAANPQSATVDGTTVTSHSIPDKIAADQYARVNSSLNGDNPQGGNRSVWGRMRPAKVTPPGAV